MHDDPSHFINVIATGEHHRMFSNMDDSPFVESVPSFIEGMREDIVQLFSSQRSHISQTLEEESHHIKKLKGKNKSRSKWVS